MSPPITPDMVEAVARAICEERTWPGAWERACEPERDAWMRDARAALDAGGWRISEGYALVPVEPTEAMIRAGVTQVAHQDIRRVWSAMVAASQHVQGIGEVGE